MTKETLEVATIEETQKSKTFEEKVVKAFKEALKEESFRKGNEETLREFAKILRILYTESAMEEAVEKLLPKTNVITKKEFYESSNKDLKPFSVITSGKKLIGYFVDISLLKELEKGSDLKPVLITLNSLALEAYKEDFCKNI